MRFAGHKTRANKQTAKSTNKLGVRCGLQWLQFKINAGFDAGICVTKARRLKQQRLLRTLILDCQRTAETVGSDGPEEKPPGRRYRPLWSGLMKIKSFITLYSTLQLPDNKIMPKWFIIGVSFVLCFVRTTSEGMKTAEACLRFWLVNQTHTGDRGENVRGYDSPSEPESRAPEDIGETYCASGRY